MKKKNVTVKDIAEAVNISVSTVSRALNDHPKISSETKEKVWLAARKLGYQPNLPAYMTPETSKTICFLLPELESGFYQSVAQGIQQVAHEKGYSLFIAPLERKAQIEQNYLQSIISLNIEGVIFAVYDKTADTSPVNHLTQLKVPLVYLNKSDHEQSGTTLISDISHGTYQAVQHLFSMNFDDILLFAGIENDPFFTDMIDGYRIAHSIADKPVDENRIYARKMRFTDVEEVLEKLHRNSALPDAIIAPNEKKARFIINWAQNKGLQIPDDLAIISFSNSETTSKSLSMVTSVQFSGKETGIKAALKLFEQIKSGTIKNETLIIPSKLIIKGSTLKVRK